MARESERCVDHPGIANAWTMPSRPDIDMLTTGVARRSASGARFRLGRDRGNWWTDRDGAEDNSRTH